MTIEVLDPTHESASPGFLPARRLATLKGSTVGFISNGKEVTRGFFDALECRLRDDYEVAEVVRLTKRNYSAPVEPELLAQADRFDGLVAGVGD